MVVFGFLELPGGGVLVVPLFFYLLGYAFLFNNTVVGRVFLGHSAQLRLFNDLLRAGLC